MTLIVTIIGALNTILNACRNVFGLFIKKPQTTDQANDRQAQASVDAEQVRDRAAAAVEQAREQTDLDRARVRDAAASGGVDGLHKERETVDEAIKRANASRGL